MVIMRPWLWLKRVVAGVMGEGGGGRVGDDGGRLASFGKLRGCRKVEGVGGFRAVAGGGLMARRGKEGGGRGWARAKAQ